MALLEALEDTLDWMANRCGLTVPPRPPRRIRHAARALASETLAARNEAEKALAAERLHAAPLLRQIARSPRSGAHSVRAAVLLCRLQEKDAPDLLRRMVRDSDLRNGPPAEVLKVAVREVVGMDYFIRQATQAVTHLEQRPESFKAIVRFRQASEILRFLEAPLQIDLMRRALVVRTVGGENLSLVRAVMSGQVGVAVEHVCMVRMEAAYCIVASGDRENGYRLLADNLAHPNPAVQLTAMGGIEVLGDERVIDQLHAIAQNPNSPIRAEARSLIERFGLCDTDVLTLLRACHHEDRSPETLLRPQKQPIDHASETLLRPDWGG